MRDEKPAFHPGVCKVFHPAFAGLLGFSSRICGIIGFFHPVFAGLYMNSLFTEGGMEAARKICRNFQPLTPMVVGSNPPFSSKVHFASFVTKRNIHNSGFKTL